jgi:hypothetical protein
VTSTPPPQLDYAPPPSLVTRIGRRRLIWFGVVMAFAIAINNWGYPLMRRVERWNAERAYHRLQKTRMAYAAPADRVVYEEDPTEAAALLKRDPAYKSIDVLDATQAIAVKGPPWQPPVMFTEALWTQFAGGVVPIPPPQRSVAFMGERTTPSGERRLVCVGIGVAAQQSLDEIWSMNRWLQAWSFKTDTLDSAAQTAPMGQMIMDSGAPRPKTINNRDPVSNDPVNPYTPPFPLRLYAGQKDPADGSRFTIPYALRGHRGVIVGTLNDDGSILLTPDIGWHGRLGTTVSWTPKVRATPARAPTGPSE